MEAPGRNVCRARCANHDAKQGRLRPACSKMQIAAAQSPGSEPGVRSSIVHWGMGLRVIGKRDIVPAIRHAPALIPVALPLDRTPRPSDSALPWSWFGGAGFASFQCSSPTRYFSRWRKEHFLFWITALLFPLSSTGTCTGRAWPSTSPCVSPSSARFSPACLRSTRDQAVGSAGFPGGGRGSAVGRDCSRSPRPPGRYAPNALPGSPFGSGCKCDAERLVAGRGRALCLFPSFLA